MPRTTYVKKAQASKRSRSCAVCGHVIQPGEPYSWAKIKLSRGGRFVYACSQHRLRDSHKTNSPHWGAIYSAAEAAEDARLHAKGEPDDAQIVRDYGENIRAVGEGYRESAQNIEDGFGHATSMSEELAEKADACESFADERDSAADDIESMDDPNDVEDIKQEFDGEVDEAGEPLDEEEWELFLEEKVTERQDAILDAIDEQISEYPEV